MHFSAPLRSCHLVSELVCPVTIETIYRLFRYTRASLLPLLFLPLKPGYRLLTSHHAALPTTSFLRDVTSTWRCLVFVAARPHVFCACLSPPNLIFSFPLLYNLDLSAFSQVFSVLVRLPISLSLR